MCKYYLMASVPYKKTEHDFPVYTKIINHRSPVTVTNNSYHFWKYTFGTNDLQDCGTFKVPLLKLLITSWEIRLISKLSKEVDDVVMLCKNPHSLSVWMLIWLFCVTPWSPIKNLIIRWTTTIPYDWIKRWSRDVALHLFPS